MSNVARKPKTLTVEIDGAQIIVSFTVREDGTIVDKGQLQAPPIFSAAAARKWLSVQERELLANVRKARDAAAQ